MYWQEDDLDALGKNVIQKYKELNALDDPDCRIVYQYCDKAKKSNGLEVFADTELVKEKLKLFIEADFIITFYTGNTEALDADRLEKLMYHELCHVGYNPSADGMARFCIIPHDVEDFRSVIDKWGIDWVKGDDKTGRKRTTKTRRSKVQKQT